VADTKMKSQIRLILQQLNKFKIIKAIVNLHDKCVRSKQVHEKFLEYIDELEVEAEHDITIPLTHLISKTRFANLPTDVKRKLIDTGMCPMCGSSITVGEKETFCEECVYVFEK